MHQPRVGLWCGTVTPYESIHGVVKQLDNLPEAFELTDVCQCGVLVTNLPIDHHKAAIHSCHQMFQGVYVLTLGSHSSVSLTVTIRVETETLAVCTISCHSDKQARFRDLIHQ